METVFPTVIRVEGLYGRQMEQELAVRKEPPFIEDLSTEAENSHCLSRYQATASDYTADWKRLNVCSSDLKSVEVSDSIIVISSYDL